MTEAVVDTKDLQSDITFELELTLGEHREGFQRLVRAIKSVRLNESPVKQIPFAVLDPVDGGDGIELQVFPNIMVDISDFKSVEELHARRLIKPTTDTVAEDLQDDRKSMRWKRAAKNTIRKKESVNIARYLRKAFDLQGQGKRDDEIRDLADRITEFAGPAKLVYCETPEDYVKMFTCDTKTCSMVHSKTHRTPTLDKLAAQGRYSSEWFHYNPHTQGVYLFKDGVVTARAVLLRQDITQPFRHYHQALGISYEHAGILLQRLESMGIRSFGRRLSITEHFEVPVTEFEGRKLMPLPYHDSISPDYYIAWDEANNVFRCGPGNDRPKGIRSVVEVSYYNWGGWASTTLQANERVH